MAARKKTNNKVSKLLHPPETAPQKADTISALNFPVVGIGASAGGLQAMEAFFAGIPSVSDPGMAFVVVQHLSPDHKSLLTELLRRHTRMQIFEVEDGMAVKPDCVYIIPPNRNMALTEGVLRLSDPDIPRGHRLPIDYFFRSLAQDQHERAICIVLSGTGSDGTLGVRSVKGEGGMVMVQTPASAEYDGMPCSAIATGMADYELLPAEMPARIISYAAQAFRELPPGVTAPARAEAALKEVFALLRAQTSHDFSQYKPNTIHRRIERRMAVNQISTIAGYAKHLRVVPGEVDALFRDLLIGVTSFFRDLDVFQKLEEQVIPKLFTGKPGDGLVRVWVPACSTGEEAYSIAILLQERVAALKKNIKVQVFATDIDGRAIAVARAGVYPASIAADISPERLARFFSAEPGGAAYRINKSIRDLLIFSEQDVIKDPPFSKLDLICCRNLMIYMGAALQKMLIPLFHNALNSGGFLFLGTSETVGEYRDIFAILDSKLKVYQRKEDLLGIRGRSLGRFLSSMTPPCGALAAPPARKRVPGKPPLRELAEQLLLQQVAPSGAIVDGRGDILYLHGRAGVYLEPVEGTAGVNNILKMAREGLRRELTEALHKSAASKESIRCTGLRVKTEGEFATVTLSVVPIKADQSVVGEVPLYLVAIEQERPATIRKASKKSASQAHRSKDSHADNSDAIIISLRRELKDKEEYLRATNEELETFNEELKSSNEEMQSMNEELQSTNEELETSKEELQSVNEELISVNAELQSKVSDLSRLNNDINNLVSGTGIATIFVDRQMRILRFTPTALRIINLVHSDTGRPINHIVSNLIGYDSLVADAQEVLQTLASKEVEVRTKSGEFYTMRILPYRTLEDVIEGVVITFNEITRRMQVEQELKESKGLLESVVENIPNMLFLKEAKDLRFVIFNRAGEELLGYDRKALLGKNNLDLFPQEQAAHFMAKDREVLDGEAGFLDIPEEPISTGKKGERLLHTRKVCIRGSDGVTKYLLGISEDITERKEAEIALYNSAVKYRNLIETTGTGYLILDAEGRVVEANKEYVRLSGHENLRQILGRRVTEWTAEYEKQRNAEAVARCIKDGRIRNFIVDYVDAGGRIMPVEINATVEGKGKDARIVSICRDITERRQQEKERMAMQLQLQQSQKMESVGRLAGGVAHDFNNLLTAITGYAGFLLTELKEGDPKLDDVKEIIAAAERATGLTRQLLAFSRKQILKPQVVDLNESVGGMLKLLKRLIGENIKFEPKLAERPCQVKVDSGQIDQILVNLAVNARDAMPKGGTLILETAIVTPGGDFFLRHADLPPGPLVCMSVRDTGCGMTEDVKSHLFEPFFTTKEKEKGLGLGLSTVFGIVKQSGGDIEVESSPDGGACFRVYFPHIEHETPEKPMEQGKGKLLRGSETILLVEDEESLRRLGVRLLRMSGYAVVAAADGKEALAAAERHGKPFDLLMTDVVMPGMSGRELSLELARRKLVGRTLFMSGYTDDAIVQHGVLEPGIAFIYKPFTGESLSAKLREVLDGPADKAKP